MSLQSQGLYLLAISGAWLCKASVDIFHENIYFSQFRWIYYLLCELTVCLRSRIRQIINRTQYWQSYYRLDSGHIESQGDYGKIILQEMLDFVGLRAPSRRYTLRIVSSDSLREAGPFLRNSLSISWSTNPRRRFNTVLIMTRHCTQASWIRYSSSHLPFFHINLILSSRALRHPEFSLPSRFCSYIFRSSYLPTHVTCRVQCILFSIVLMTLRED